MARLHSRGFTLIEVLAALVVLAIISTVASRTIMVALDGYLRASTQAQLHSELSTTLDRIQMELRKIPIKVGYGSIAPDISNVTSTSLTWTGNYGLSLVGDELRLTDNGAATAILLDDVTGLTIQTYNESNTALGASLSGTSCDPIRRISVTLTVQRSGFTETLRTKIFLRNTLDGATS